jgi:hypothetical protein
LYSGEVVVGGAVFEAGAVAILVATGVAEVVVIGCGEVGEADV